MNKREFIERLEDYYGEDVETFCSDFNITVEMLIEKLYNYLRRQSACMDEGVLKDE